MSSGNKCNQFWGEPLYWFPDAQTEGHSVGRDRLETLATKTAPLAMAFQDSEQQATGHACGIVEINFTIYDLRVTPSMSSGVIASQTGYRISIDYSPFNQVEKPIGTASGCDITDGTNKNSPSDLVCSY